MSSELTKKEIEGLKTLGSVLVAKLSPEELLSLSLAHDCGELDNIMDKEVNVVVLELFPEDFIDPDDLEGSGEVRDAQTDFQE